MKRVCVFCGSSTGTRAKYAETARTLAVAMARLRIGLVYGGGQVGLMGVLADTMLAEGGEVIGVIPRPLASRELAHPGLTEMRMVETMHERKATMASLVDGFIALPGGLGTLEETLEMLTWAQLGIHRKPIGILNAEHYYDGLLALFSHAVHEGFIRREYLALFVVATEPAELLARFATWTPPDFPRAWLRPSQA
ncbi:MAG: TIGR00730 family Rossman fold protein [Candidatus Rokuibacteriota bacterium]|nr:MAG: TIGR00730 family Rossman fold protein [Candidatus Rokubacteria bacterium]